MIDAASLRKDHAGLTTRYFLRPHEALRSWETALRGVRFNLQLMSKAVVRVSTLSGLETSFGSRGLASSRQLALAPIVGGSFVAYCSARCAHGGRPPRSSRAVSKIAPSVSFRFGVSPTAASVSFLESSLRSSVLTGRQVT